MPKLTTAQLTALAKIEDNPGTVEAMTRVCKGWGRIHGNVEHTLTKLGLIEKSQGVQPVTFTAYGKQHAVDVHWWTLTTAGADALHAATHAAA
jgi:hypothetical protein